MEEEAELKSEDDFEVVEISGSNKSSGMEKRNISLRRKLSLEPV